MLVGWGGNNGFTITDIFFLPTSLDFGLQTGRQKKGRSVPTITAQ